MGIGVEVFALGNKRMCHILLLLPVLALPVFVLLPWQEALLVYLGVTVLAGVLYRLMWRDMRRAPSTGIERMMGGIGTVFQLDNGKAKVFLPRQNLGRSEQGADNHGRRSGDRWLRRDEAVGAEKGVIRAR